MNSMGVLCGELVLYDFPLAVYGYKINNIFTLVMVHSQNSNVRNV